MFPSKNVLLKLSAILLLSAGLTKLISSEYFWSRFHSLNTQLNDFLMTALPAPPPSGEVVAVSVRQEDAPSFYLKRSHADLKKIVADVMARYPKFAIATFFITATDSSKEELRDFIKFTQKFPNLYFFSTYEEYEPESPTRDPILKDLNWLFIPLPLDQGIMVNDRKVRRLIVNFTLDNPIDRMLLDLLKKYGIERSPSDYRIWKFFSSYQTYLRQRGPDAYAKPAVPEFRKNPDLGRGKIIIFGTGEASFEPIRYRSAAIYTGKIWTAHEQISMALDTLLLKDDVGRLDSSTRIAVIFILVFGYLCCLFFLSPIQSSISGFVIIVVWLIGSMLAYILADRFLFLGEMAIGLATIHFFASPALLIRYLRTKDREAAQREIALKTARAELGLKIATQVAHDIRSPLGAIQIASQMGDTKPVEAKELLSTSIDRLNRIANDLLTQFRTGQLSSKPAQQIHVMQFLNQITKSLKLTQPAIDTRIDGDENALIQINNSTDLERAVTNLLNNSIEAMGSKGSIEIAVAMDAEHCTIEIGDNGPGVPEEIRTRLFERGVTFGKARGSGLGLAQVKETLEKLGGSITLVPSTKGAHFKMVLPKIS